MSQFAISGINLTDPKRKVHYRGVPFVRIILDKDGHIKLSDFGLAKHFGVPIGAGRKKGPKFCVEGSVRALPPLINSLVPPVPPIALSYRYSIS